MKVTIYKNHNRFDVHLKMSIVYMNMWEKSKEEVPLASHVFTWIYEGCEQLEANQDLSPFHTSL